MRMAGPAAERPTGPWREGRVYRATDTGELFYDNGAGWLQYAMKDYVDAGDAALDAAKSDADHLHAYHDRLGLHADAGDWSWSPNAGSAGMAGWSLMSGDATRTQTLQLNASSIGSHAIDLTNYQWWEWNENIPYDAAMLYEGRIRVQQITAGGTFYAGYSGIAADGVTRINISGANSYSSQHYQIAAGVTLSGGEQDFYGGWAGVGTFFNRPGVPSAYAGVRYIRPLIIANYPSGQTGTLRVHGFSIKKRRWGQLPNETGTLRSNGADAGWQNATYENGWTTYGTSWAPAQFRKDANGYVYTRGLVKPPAANSGTVIFTYPAGFRPSPQGSALDNASNIHIGGIYTDGGVSVSGYLLRGNGQIQAVGTYTNWYDLAGVRPFLAEQ